MAHKPEVIKHPLSYYVDKLNNNEPFTFARYGDGEWLTILGHEKLRNSNGCSFTPELAQALQQVVKNQNGFRELDWQMIKDNVEGGLNQKYQAFIDLPVICGSSSLSVLPAYQYALLKITRRKQGDEIVKWLTDNQVTMPWYNGDLFLDKSLEGKLFPLIEQIREKRVLYVGNHRLRDLNMRRAGFFPYVSYVEPPVQNAYVATVELLREVFRAIRKNDIDFIGWSSGLAAKYFIDQVWQRYPEVTQLDFGSMFDGYFKPLSHIQEMGRAGSRSYIRSGNYDFRELLEMNTGIIK